MFSDSRFLGNALVSWNWFVGAVESMSAHQGACSSLSSLAYVGADLLDGSVANCVRDADVICNDRVLFIAAIHGDFTGTALKTFCMEILAMVQDGWLYGGFLYAFLGECFIHSYDRRSATLVQRISSHQQSFHD